jgi:hypothetical protein
LLAQFPRDDLRFMGPCGFRTLPWLPTTAHSALRTIRETLHLFVSKVQPLKSFAVPIKPTSTGYRKPIFAGSISICTA